MKKIAFTLLLALFTINSFPTPHESKIKKAAAIPIKLAIVGACFIALQMGTDICLNYNRSIKGLPLLDPITFSEKLSILIYSEYGSSARNLSLLSVFPLVGGIIYYGQSVCEDVGNLFE